MKKTIVALTCLFLLCVSIGNGLWTLEVRPASAEASPIVIEPLLGGIVPSNSSDPSYLWPADIQKAYNLPTTGGNGTIAIVDPYDDPYIRSDLQSFCTYANLTYNGARLEIHKMASSIIANNSWFPEISFDVEWAYALAPNATILLVEAINNTAINEDNTAGPMLNAVDYARNQSDVVAVSMSWSKSEFPTETGFDSYFTSTHGVAFFASAGDNGENGTWPACSPNVVGVGGTTLTLNSNGSVASETVWNNVYGETGGGISQYENETSYQLSYGIQGSNGHRGVPDVSFVAGNELAMYVNYSGYDQVFPWVGTSLGPPCWAAIYSIRPTASNPILYNIGKSVYNSSCFRDITVGGNGNYNATAGYDFCTGLGSPLTGYFNSSLEGDINLDGKVDILDAILLENAFGSELGSSNWNPLADINNDGTVNILDAILLSNDWGQNYTGGMGMVDQRSSGQPLTQGGPTIIVDPSQTTVFNGETFSVNVNITSVTNLQGWQFQLYWNNTILNCTNAVIQTPAQWQNESQDFGLGLEQNYNATNGLFDGAQAAQYPASSFNGSMTIATLTFQAMQPGTTSLTLADTLLGDSTAQPIGCTVSSGSVTVNPSPVLTIYASNGGTTNPASGQYSENYGTNVTVTATANSGDTFEYWILDGNDYSNNPITVNMTANHSLTPYFYVPPPGGCVLSGTLITMADGKTVPVQKVKPGDSIMGYDVQTGTFVTETVTSNNCTTVDEVLSINNGLLYVTPTEQPIYTDHGWVSNPQDLMIGWKIYNPTTNTWTTVQSLTTVEGNFRVYDLQATQPNTFIGNGILLDRKT